MAFKLLQVDILTMSAIKFLLAPYTNLFRFTTLKVSMAVEVSEA